MRLRSFENLAASVALILGLTTQAKAADFLYVSLTNNTIVKYDVSLATSTAVQNSMTTFASGGLLSDPKGLAFDSAGNLYAASNSNNKIVKFDPAGSGSEFATFSTGVDGPQGLAFDAAGNLYVANNNVNTITKITSGGSGSQFASNVTGAFGLAFDTSGNLYVSNIGNGTVTKLTSGGASSQFASGMAAPYGLAFDTSGNLYVTASADNRVMKYTPGGTGSQYITGLNTPRGLAFDSAGNLYVAIGGDNAIRKYDSQGVLQFTLSTGSESPNFMTMTPTAVPEPSTYAMGVIATGVMALIARRRQKARG